jgi:D-tyrosyl-tRNA(Tyr) deacylase
VRVGGDPIASIGPGILVFIGVGKGDTDADALRLAAKVYSLRIFQDNEGRMNTSVSEVGGEIMVVPQFTLMADTGRGNRPGFGEAAPPGPARTLFERFSSELRSLGVPVKTGEFGADMEVSLINDGPVTILLDSSS